MIVAGKRAVVKQTRTSRCKHSEDVISKCPRRLDLTIASWRRIELQTEPLWSSTQEVAND